MSASVPPTAFICPCCDAFVTHPLPAPADTAAREMLKLPPASGRCPTCQSPVYRISISFVPFDNYVAPPTPAMVPNALEDALPSPGSVVVARANPRASDGPLLPEEDFLLLCGKFGNKTVKSRPVLVMINRNANLSKWPNKVLVYGLLARHDEGFREPDRVYSSAVSIFTGPRVLVPFRELSERDTVRYVIRHQNYTGLSSSGFDHAIFDPIKLSLTGNEGTQGPYCDRAREHIYQKGFVAQRVIEVLYPQAFYKLSSLASYPADLMSVVKSRPLGQLLTD
jgi:hypothetical protein